MADTKKEDDRPRGPDPNIVIRDFAGMEPNRDPHDVSPGKSVHQVNVGQGPAGELRVRSGARPLRFDT